MGSAGLYPRTPLRPTLTWSDGLPRFPVPSPLFGPWGRRRPGIRRRADLPIMLMAYASIAAFFLVAAGFMIGSLLLGRLIRPNHPYAEKLETYECGEAPVGQAWFNFNPRFYIVALIYIVFDVEIA